MHFPWTCSMQKFNIFWPSGRTVGPVRWYWKEWKFIWIFHNTTLKSYFKPCYVLLWSDMTQKYYFRIWFPFCKQRKDAGLSGYCSSDTLELFPWLKNCIFWQNIFNCRLADDEKLFDAACNLIFLEIWAANMDFLIVLKALIFFLLITLQESFHQSNITFVGCVIHLKIKLYQL